MNRGSNVDQYLVRAITGRSSKLSAVERHRSRDPLSWIAFGVFVFVALAWPRLSLPNDDQRFAKAGAGDAYAQRNEHPTFEDELRRLHPDRSERASMCTTAGLADATSVCGGRCSRAPQRPKLGSGSGAGLGSSVDTGSGTGTAISRSSNMCGGDCGCCGRRGLP